MSEDKINYWTKQLEKESLKEPKMKNKMFWIKPLTYFHVFEFRGLDPRDKYEPAEIDQWDAQVWNLPTHKRALCKEYYVDYLQCYSAVRSEFTFWSLAYAKQGLYCWKQYDNYQNCKAEFGHHHPEYYLKGSKIGHH